MNEQLRPAFCRAKKLAPAFLFVLLGLFASCGVPADRPDRGTGNSVGHPSAAVLNSNVVIRSVQVSPKLPTYRFVLTPDFAVNKTAQGPHHIGRIDISAENSKKLLQTINVEGADASWLATSFHTLDINFDGYLDFATVYEVGGKYSRDSYWLFDPRSGHYVTNALTTELRELSHNGLTLDPQKQEIRTSLFIGVCQNSFQIYRVENGHLVLMESEIHNPIEPGRCVVEKRKRINGELVLIETKEREHE